MAMTIAPVVVGFAALVSTQGAAAPRPPAGLESCFPSLCSSIGDDCYAPAGEAATCYDDAKVSNIVGSPPQLKGEGGAGGAGRKLCALIRGRPLPPRNRHRPIAGSGRRQDTFVALARRAQILTGSRRRNEAFLTARARGPPDPSLGAHLQQKMSVC